MEKKIQKNNRFIQILGDNNFSKDENKSINHTNINNNINITNYYHSPPHNYFKKGTLTFINENSIIQNIISCPIKTATHRTQKIQSNKKSSINITIKKCNQCLSPYVKKIPPNKKEQKSIDKNRINKILKTYHSSQYITSQRIPSSQYITSPRINIMNNKNKTKYNNCNDYFNRTKEKLFDNCKKGKNKDQNNIIHYYTNLPQNKINNNNKRRHVINLDKSLPQFKTKDKNDSLFNVLEKKIELFLINNKNNYDSKTYNQNNINRYNFGSPKLIKNNYNKNILNNKGNFDEKRVSKYLILIQSVFKGYLLRIKFKLYKAFINQIKKGYYILKSIYIKNKKRKFFLLLKYKINNVINKKFNFSDLIPSNNISVFLNANNDNLNSQLVELQEELNKRKKEYLNLEKKLNELISENKKIQNINNIIVSDNKQLAMKLKNYEVSRYDNLEIKNNNFFIVTSKNQKANILIKFINMIENSNKTLLYKNFYKFYFQTKLIGVKYKINKKKKENLLIVKKNNFSINKNIEEKNIINKDEENKILRNNKLKDVINHKYLQLYFFRNVFEKWMLKSIVLKNKEILMEKRKKKKEKFRQRKERKLYNGYNNDRKTNYGENDNNYDSEEYKEESNYYFNKHKYNKKYSNNYYEKEYE